MEVPGRRFRLQKFEKVTRSLWKAKFGAHYYSIVRTLDAGRTIGWRYAKYYDEQAEWDPPRVKEALRLTCDLLSSLPSTAEIHAAELCCATGEFTVGLASKLRELAGRWSLHAVDINPYMLRMLKQKLAGYVVQTPFEEPADQAATSSQGEGDDAPRAGTVVLEQRFIQQYPLESFNFVAWLRGFTSLSGGELRNLVRNLKKVPVGTLTLFAFPKSLDEKNRGRVNGMVKKLKAAGFSLRDRHVAASDLFVVLARERELAPDEPVVPEAHKLGKRAKKSKLAVASEPPDIPEAGEEPPASAQPESPASTPAGSPPTQELGSGEKKARKEGSKSKGGKLEHFRGVYGRARLPESGLEEYLQAASDFLRTHSLVGFSMKKTAWIFCWQWESWRWGRKCAKKYSDLAGQKLYSPKSPQFRAITDFIKKRLRDVIMERMRRE
ncbi:MAG: hypothetical protein Kow0069_18760 [Promethearchaeota archaeon]